MRAAPPSRSRPARRRRPAAAAAGTARRPARATSSASMRPPCASMKRREVGSPSPVPFGLVVKNGSNRCSRASADRPGPSSATSMIASLSDGAQRDLDPLPRLDRVLDQVHDHALDLVRVAARAQRGRRVHVQVDAALGRQLGQRPDGARHDRPPDRPARDRCAATARTTAANRPRRAGARSRRRPAGAAGRPAPSLAGSCAISSTAMPRPLSEFFSSWAIAADVLPIAANRSASTSAACVASSSAVRSRTRCSSSAAPSRSS